MTLAELIHLAETYQGLGWSIQSQLSDLLTGASPDFNRAALHYIYVWLKEVERTCSTDQTLQDDLAAAREELEEALKNTEDA